MNLPLGKWLQISFVNLMLVVFIGIILRYKIAYSLPFVNQKYLLHGHSHFAFAGWVTQVLMVLLVAWLGENGGQNSFKNYRFLLYANLLCAYGMLLTFPLQGYGAFSISFSTLSVAISYFFALRFRRDLSRLSPANTAHKWFKTAVFFNALSSLGVFIPAYMMATKNIHQNVYLAAIYFYLHFQYNGWFFFACMGLLCTQLARYGVKETHQLLVYRLFAWACIPAYLLSVLWLAVPAWIYALVVVAVLMQLGGLIRLIKLVKPLQAQLKQQFSKTVQYLMLLSAVALTLKLCLQAGSVMPSMSKLAFGFRPIVIGYLHLMLLGVITIFITGYCIAAGYIRTTATIIAGVIVFVGGIIINEALLMIQGVADLGYKEVPFINTLLLAVAIILFAGILIINYGIKKYLNQ